MIIIRLLFLAGLAAGWPLIVHEVRVVYAQARALVAEARAPHVGIRQGVIRMCLSTGAISAVYGALANTTKPSYARQAAAAAVRHLDRDLDVDLSLICARVFRREEVPLPALLVAQALWREAPAVRKGLQISTSRR